MAYARATQDTRFVCPLVTFVFEHSFRCLTENGGRIVEFAAPMPVQYPRGIPFQLLKVLDDTGAAKYVTKKGWMFDGAALHDLMMEKKLSAL